MDKLAKKALLFFVVLLLVACTILSVLFFEGTESDANKCKIKYPHGIEMQG